ncbi:ATP-binding protein [Magnetovibrio sp. PR-2]|uniref:sensor histidine kinase n=1 Tax=Magnetovibrio sp. PR-2 TaxID=3120356 RepID=UPI002FCE1125
MAVHHLAIVEWVKRLPVWAFVSVFVVIAVAISETLVVIESFVMHGKLDAHLMLAGFITPLITAAIMAWVVAWVLGIATVGHRNENKARLLLVDAIESVNGGVVLFDSKDRLVLCNEQYRHILPCSPEVVIPGITFEQLLRELAKSGTYLPDDIDAETFLKNRVEAHRKGLGVSNYQVKDGRWFEIEERRTNEGGVIVIVRDITQQMQAQHELEKSRDEAALANKTKSEFLASMSHELRTPLNAIIGFSGTMKDELFGAIENEKYLDYLGDIHRSGEHLLELINDILDASAIEAGAMSLNESIINLGDMINVSLRLIKPRALTGKVSLSTDIAIGLPQIQGDARRVRQILLNLLSNAVKFTPEDGKIKVRAFMNDDGSLFISVQDTGIGMAEADIETAMSDFGQVDSGLNRKHEGTGLGLPLTKGLVELHGGVLKINSEPGQGTQAVVSFPPVRVIRSVRAVS